MNSQVTSKKGAAKQSSIDDTDKWLMPDIKFKFPQKPGAAWMLIPQTPYIVDMSRYFTDIAGELDKWLTKGSGSEMEWNQAPNESLLALDQRFAGVYITGRPANGSDWLMMNQDGMAYNPMANYMKNAGGVGNCGECKGKPDCAAINLF